jgi:mannose/cellobiose epimerase-like protein (N-acyl-D-glucosamine 2-epimerase family)/mannose-1-phosphate guanylyltransferase
MPGVLSPIVVAGEAHAVTIGEQLAELGLSATVLLEPEGRDSAPATAAAAALMLSAGRDCAAIMQPADHHIPDVEEFRTAARRAADAAGQGFIVTFGVTPTHPETSYGYISAADSLPGCPDVAAVRRFIEKPCREKAIEYLTDGFVWNSGMFAFRPSVLLEELAKFEPAMAAAVKDAVAGAKRDGDVVRLDPAAFGRATKKSLDHAVMEHTTKAAVVAADFSWSDLGAWNAIYQAHAKDEHGNVVAGENAVIVNSERCLIRAPHIPVAVIGLSDVAVIAEPDGIVVCRREASADVKSVVDALRRKGRPEGLRRSTRPPIGGALSSLAAASGALDSWLWTSALPLWWTMGADHQRGGFFELLGADGAPVAAPRRMRVQARQAYVYAKAGAAGWPGPWRVAVTHGLAALESYYRRPDGLYRTLVSNEGEPLDDTAFLYDQAFVLLALAAAAKAADAPRPSEEIAAALRDRVVGRFARKGGGFSEQAAQGSTFQSNPHMHLLEAALEWSDVAGSAGTWLELADSIVQVCLTHFVDADSGALREFFDDDGKPVAALPGRIVEPGHQFEWAWLLLRWSTLQKDAKAAEAARRLIEIGERHGIDPLRGVAMDSLLDDMSQQARQARLWPQTERLKAALALASQAGSAAERAAAEAHALAAANGLAHYLQTSVPGLWHDKMRADGTFVAEPSPASSLYHICGAILQLRNYTDR